MSVEVLTVSSKGQIVLPADIRKKMEINSGDKLAAYVYNDVIMLKVIKMPTESDFKKDLDAAKAWAASVGYKESDIASIIKDVRNGGAV